MGALHRFNNSGKNTSVWTAEGAGVDPSGGKFIASCDEHGTLVNQRTERGAITSAQYPHNFCEECQDDLHRKAGGYSSSELADAWEKAYKNHHDTFSWDNPDHYANNAKY